MFTHYTCDYNDYTYDNYDNYGCNRYQLVDSVIGIIVAGSNQYGNNSNNNSV